MKVRKRLKSQSNISHYRPPSRIIIREGHLDLLKRLGIPLEVYAKNLAEEYEYKRRYA